MAIVNYAIEIDVDVGVSDAYAGWSGMVTYITGVEEYGTSTYPTYEGGTTNYTKYHAGWITKDGLGLPSRSVDITMSGQYGTMSGFSFSVRNDTKLWDYLNDTGIYLANRPIRLYSVIDNVFYPTWAGVISENPRNEEVFTYNCIDTFRSIHKQMPPVPISVSNNPNISDESQGKTVPISIGNIPYAKLQDSGIKPEFKTLFTLNGIDHDRAAAKYLIVSTRSDGKTPGYSIALWLHVPGTLAISVDQFKGCYAMITGGGGSDPNRGYRILSNTAASAGSGLDRCIACELTMSPPGYDDDTNSLLYVDGTTPSAFNSDTSVWQIASIAIKGIISEDAVSMIELDPTTGIPMLYTWDQSSSRYMPIQPAIVSYDATTTNVLGHPYVEVASSSVGSGSSFKNQIPVKPVIKYLSASVVNNGYYIALMAPAEWTVYDQFMSAPTDASLDRYMYYPGTDLDKVTDYTRLTQLDVPAFTTGKDIVSIKLCCDIHDIMDDTFDELHFDMDWYLSGVTTPPFRAFYEVMVFRLRDIYGNLITDVDTTPVQTTWGPGGMMNFYGTGAGHTSYFLPSEYFDFGGNDGGFGDYFSYHTSTGFSKLPSDIFTFIKNGVADSNIEVHIQVLCTGGVPNINSGTTLHIIEAGFVGVKTVSLDKGELYARIKGELTGTDQVTNVYLMYKHILEDYDGIAAASINYGNLASTRFDWYVSRQITERKSSFDYLDELCKHSMVALVPTRTGKRLLSAWREDATTAISHGGTTILRDSIISVVDTPMNQVYNQFYLQYAWDPAQDKYMRILMISKVEENTFPAITSNWYDYVSLLSENSYSDAKAIWTACHNSYLKNKTLSPSLSADYSELAWYTDASIYDPTSSVGAGTDSAAFKYLVNLIEWITRQKQVINYSIPLTATNIAAVELLSPVEITDVIYTNNAARTGWITGIEINPNTNSIHVTAILEPEGPLDVFDDVSNRGTPLNDGMTIDESGSRPDVISEQ